MSMVLTRSPLEPIGMNGAGGGGSKRRSARLSAEGSGENEPPAKKSRTTTVSTKETDGAAAGGVAAAAKRKKRVYEEGDDDFAFSRSKKPKAKPAPAVRNSEARQKSPEPQQQPVTPAPPKDAAPKTGQKTRRRLPTTPERDAADRTVATKTIRRSKRISDEHCSSDTHTSPHKPAHAKSHAKQDRSPSPEKARPVTVEKKRKHATPGPEEEKVTRIQLPFADTPVIKRNKEMRKASAENGSRRSSAGMRGRRASSLIGEGRGNGELFETSPEAGSPIWTQTALSTRPSWSEVVSRTTSRTESESGRSGLSTPPPSEDLDAIATELHEIHCQQEQYTDTSILIPALPHSEVPAAEFYKHISAELTEPRRMRCLLGWCGTRTLPPKPEAPKGSTEAANAEFQARQSARVIQAELSQDLVTKSLLSDWFSRDDDAPPRVPLRKKPNPRNVANAAKAEDLERELERLRKERAEWDDIIASAAQSIPSTDQDDTGGDLSPLHPELLDSPQRALLEQLQAPTATSTDPTSIQQRLSNISENLEFTLDQFSHGVHALSTAIETAERLAERSLGDAASVLEERERERRVQGKAVGTMDALRGLARVLNLQRR